MEEELPLIKNDPYLKDHRGMIEYIVKRCHDKETSIGDLIDFANGHNFLGLIKTATGYTFREWAPNAYAVYLVGDFSSWKVLEKYALYKNGDIWEINLSFDEMHEGDHYRMHVKWPKGEGDRIPSYANYVVQDSHTKIFSAKVCSLDEFKFHPFTIPSGFAPTIYEAHIGMAQIDPKIGTYDEFRRLVLPRIKKAGYNTLQLMAIHEHPYYGSFGYQVSNFFAPSSRFGTPNDLRLLIDDAHKMGIAVIMDIVHSHAVRNEIEGIANLDGTDYQYFHSGPRGDHSAWGTKCFDYGKDKVIHFLLSNCKYWIEKFNFDGFRFDGVTSMLYKHHGMGPGFNSYHDYFNDNLDIDALVYLYLANRLIHKLKKNAFTCAEDVSGLPGLAVSAKNGGIGLDFRLAMGIPDFWIRYLSFVSDDDWNMDEIFNELTNRRSDEKLISYTESHDQALVGDKTIAFRLMDKEMYFNMSIDLRNLTIDRGLSLHKMIRLVTAFTARGGYLNFMGNEFGHPEWIDFPREGNNWSYHHARRRWDLVDNSLLCYKFLAEFDKEMIAFVNDTDILTFNDPEKVFSHCDDKVLGIFRKKYLAIFNFHPNKSFADYKMKVPYGKYKIILNSDLSIFGGFDRIPNDYLFDVKDGVLSVYIPSRTAIILKRYEGTV